MDYVWNMYCIWMVYALRYIEVKVRGHVHSYHILEIPEMILQVLPLRCHQVRLRTSPPNTPRLTTRVFALHPPTQSTTQHRNTNRSACLHCSGIVLHRLQTPLSKDVCSEHYAGYDFKYHFQKMSAAITTRTIVMYQYFQ